MPMLNEIKFRAGRNMYRIQRYRPELSDPVTRPDSFTVWRNRVNMGGDADGSSICEDDIIAELFRVAEENLCLRMERDSAVSAAAKNEETEVSDVRPG